MKQKDNGNSGTGNEKGRMGEERRKMNQRGEKWASGRKRGDAAAGQSAAFVGVTGSMIQGKTIPRCAPLRSPTAATQVGASTICTSQRGSSLTGARRDLR